MVDFSVNGVNSADAVSGKSFTGDVQVNKNSDTDCLSELIANTNNNDDLISISKKKKKISDSAIVKQAARNEADSFKEYFNEGKLQYYASINTPELADKHGAVAYYFYRDLMGNEDYLKCYQKVNDLPENMRQEAFKKLEGNTQALMSLAKKLGLETNEKYKQLETVYKEISGYVENDPDMVFKPSAFYMYAMDNTIKDLLNEMKSYDHKRDEYRESRDSSIDIQ